MAIEKRLEVENGEEQSDSSRCNRVIVRTVRAGTRTPVMLLSHLDEPKLGRQSNLSLIGNVRLLECILAGSVERVKPPGIAAPSVHVFAIYGG